MISLDDLEESNESFELYCRIGVLLLTGRLSYLDWVSTVKGLGIHNYVLPADRALVEVLLDVIYSRHKKSSAMLMWHALLMGHIECHFTETQQIRMLNLLMTTQPAFKVARHKLRTGP